MQKLRKRNTYTPTGTSLARGNCDLSLNREVNLSSVSSLKTSLNNLEETQPQRKGGQDSRVLVNVYVLNRNKQPLMPTTPAKARRLLKANKAKVVKRCPFTIQLLGPSGEAKQKITCGIDSGYEKIGFDCLTEKKVLIHGEVKLETKKRLIERRMYRKNRRNKLWYRKPRFLNRKKSEGWLPPSIQRRFDAHISLIERLKSILPITKVIVEVGQFDIQKLDNPDIQGVEYQQGNLCNYVNKKSYIFTRENGTCQFCGKKEGKFHLHHIISKGQGGTDKPNNLALLHESCHKKMHKQHLENTLKKNKQYKASTFMNIVNKRFQDYGYEITYGYITSINRNNLGLEKTHYNDAFVIAGGTTQEIPKLHNVIQKRKNNRSLQLNKKGSKPIIRRQHYINQPHDLIKYNGEICEVIGTHCLGKAVQARNNLGKRIEARTKNVVLLYHTNSFVWKLQNKGGVNSSQD